MNRTHRNWIFVLSLNLLPLSLITTSGVLDYAITAHESESSVLSAFNRAPASTQLPDLSTPEQIAEARKQVTHCNKTHAELDFAFERLQALVKIDEYSDREVEDHLRRMDRASAKLTLADFRKLIEEASDKSELDQIRNDLMAWAGDSENLKTIRDDEMSGADKVADLMKEVAAKYAELLEDNPQRKNKAMIATLERALKLRGISRNMAQEMRNDIATYRRENLTAVAQGGMLNNPQFMISYMETINAIQTDMMRSCTGWGLEVMTTCRAAQSQLTSLQQIPMIAQRADQQKQRMQQQQEAMIQKMMQQQEAMMQQSFQVMNQNSFVNPLVANPGNVALPQIQGTGQVYF